MRDFRAACKSRGVQTILAVGAALLLSNCGASGKQNPAAPVPSLQPPMTPLQQGWSLVADGHYYSEAISKFNQAGMSDPKGASLGRCMAAYRMGYTNDVEPYCTEAIELGNTLPPEIKFHQKSDGTAGHCYLWDLDHGDEGCSIFACVANNEAHQTWNERLCEDKPGACEAPGVVREIGKCRAIAPIPKENCPVDWPKWAKQHSHVPFTADESKACRQYAVCVRGITGFLAAAPNATRETVQRWAIAQTEMVPLCHGIATDMRRWADIFYKQRPSPTCAAHMALFACFSGLVGDDD